jgi:hypothetical protein
VKNSSARFSSRQTVRQLHRTVISRNLSWIRHGLSISGIVVTLISPLFAGGKTIGDDKEKKQDAVFIKTMKAFVEGVGLDSKIQPGYVCQNGQEVCGPVAANFEEFLSKRPDFLSDTYNFHRAHPGSTCSYRGKSGSSHYSLHVVCYGDAIAGVHIDVRLPEGLRGTFEHNVRDVAENYFKIYALRIKNSHTSEKLLARHFSKWWYGYKSAYPQLAARDMPAELAELLNSSQPKATNASLHKMLRLFR